MIAASTTSQNLLHRAAEIDVDHIEPGGNQSPGAGGELLGFGSHQLAADRMIVVGQVQEVLGAFALADAQQELIQHHLAQRVRSAQAASDPPHRPVAVPGQGGLDHGESDGNGAMDRSASFTDSSLGNAARTSGASNAKFVPLRYRSRYLPRTPPLSSSR
jgi:hypothetical protein